MGRDSLQRAPSNYRSADVKHPAQFRFFGELIAGLPTAMLNALSERLFNRDVVENVIITIINSAQYRVIL